MDILELWGYIIIGLRIIRAIAFIICVIILIKNILEELKLMKLDKKLINELEEITMTDYGFNENGETDNWDIIVEDLIKEYANLKEEFEFYKNYKPEPDYEVF